jgi:hypothetical protein
VTTRGDPNARWYRNLPLVVGLVLMLLGLGNWLTGEIRTEEQRASALQERPNGIGPSAEEIEIARVRMDFYHVIASGGRLLAAAGFLLAAIGLARHLRPPNRRSEGVASPQPRRDDAERPAEP